MSLVDIAIILGSLLLIAGTAWIYPPAGLIVAGLIVLCIAIMGATHGQTR